MECESFLRFGVGLDRDYEILEMGKSVGLINKAGSWFAAEFLADFGVDKKDFTFQGEYKLYQAFQENKDWMDKLNIKVNEFIGVKS
jgi:hypothetical protein